MFQLFQRQNVLYNIRSPTDFCLSSINTTNYGLKSVTLFRMGLFGAAHGWRVAKRPPSKNLSHISYRDETWHSYTLPKKDPRNI